MASLKERLEGFLKTSRKKAPEKKRKKESVKIILFKKQSDIPKIMKLAKNCPLILLSIKDYRKKNNDSLKESLKKLKEGGELEEIQSKLLDQNWVVVFPQNTSLVG